MRNPITLFFMKSRNVPISHHFTYSSLWIYTRHAHCLNNILHDSGSFLSWQDSRKERIYLRKRERERKESEDSVEKKPTVSISGRADGSQSCSWLANASPFQRDSHEDAARASGPVCVTCHHANSKKAAISRLSWTLLSIKPFNSHILIRRTSCMSGLNEVCAKLWTHCFMIF